MEETICEAGRTSLFELGGIEVILQRQFTDRFCHARYELTNATQSSNILVSRFSASFGQHRGLQSLGWSPRFTVFPSNLIDENYKMKTLRMLRKSGPATRRDSWCGSNGERPLVTGRLFGFRSVSDEDKKVKPNRSFWCISELDRQFARPAN